MKRRKFCRYVLLSSAGFAGIVGSHHTFTSASEVSPTKSHHQWVILYWMPYDNDLVRFGEPIVQMLTQGTQNSDVAVVVQSDYWGDKKMRRRQLIDGNISEINITGEDSSDISIFHDYLNWANKTFTAENWAIIVVGHGGKINEISPDDHGVSSQVQTWMRIDQFANVVEQFNQKINSKVELLFFQNCNKATLEVIYEARNCARYTLASQLTLGAPNYYYQGFLNALKDPSIKGREAAITIMDSERADMYHTFTLVDNQAVKLIPDKLSPLLKEIVAHDLPKLKPSEVLNYSYFGEQHCDILILLNALSKDNDQAQKQFTQFAQFLRSSVITAYKTGGEFALSFPENQFNLAEFCGLSLYLPETENTISRYQSMALYQELSLVNLYKKLITPLKT
jgi:hypothetical protein